MNLAELLRHYNRSWSDPNSPEKCRVRKLRVKTQTDQLTSANV